MLKIVIVGSGNIGSRHLQAFAHLEERPEIWLIDPSEQNLAQAMERFFSVEIGNPAFDPIIHQSSAIPEGKSFDCALVATSSKVRAAVTTELLEGNSVRYLILEKFLFQKRSDFQRVGELVDAQTAGTWVNHWISDTYAYTRAAQRVIQGRPFKMEVTGKGWGLCCNAVHHLEFFDYLVGRHEIDCLGTDFERGCIESKRPGYLEINGGMIFESRKDGSRLSLRCEGTNVNFATITTKISAGSDSVVLNLKFNVLEADFEVGGERSQENFVVYPQSRRSQKVIHDLLLSGNCGLPSYERSAYQHLLVFDRFREHFIESGEDVGETCPVT